MLKPLPRRWVHTNTEIPLYTGSVGPASCGKVGEVLSKRWNLLVSAHILTPCLNTAALSRPATSYLLIFLRLPLKPTEDNGCQCGEGNYQE